MHLLKQLSINSTSDTVLPDKFTMRSKKKAYFFTSHRGEKAKLVVVLYSQCFSPGRVCEAALWLLL
jgi:hypothetical protein